MQSSKFRRVLPFAASALLVVAAFAGGRAFAAGVPATGALTYSGVLEDAAGVALTGSHNVQVSFWAAATGGTSPLCQTASTAIVLEPGGRFTVALPDTCAAATRANPNVWAEVTADGSPLGRAKLGAVPYALEAASATQAVQGARRVVGSAAQAAQTCAGQTTPGSTNWQVYSSYITVTVDISACGFKDPPVLTSSLSGDSSHWTTTGGASPYSVTATSFSIYVFQDGGITPTAANTNKWAVNWVAVGN